MITADLITEVNNLLPSEQIEVNSLNHPLGNGGRIIVYPKSEEEISNVLKYANSKGKKISVIGGGTKRGYGGLTESVDILLSLANYKGIVEHTVGDMTLTVKPGTTFKDLQEYLAKYNQQISMDPAWPEYATIGGIIASNESGPKRLGYGSARDVVIGLRMAYPDGSIIRAGGKVVKNVAGYDMNKLYIGSMGTLGVITEVTVKLRPLSQYESLILLPFPDGKMEDIRSFVTTILDSMIEPTSLELLSPSLSERLTGKNHYTLAISFEDVETSVHYQENFVKNYQPVTTEMTILQQKDAKFFWDNFYKISPNGVKVNHSAHEVAASLKIGVTNMDVLHVIRESHSLNDTGKLVVESHGGLGHGLCQVNLKGEGKEIISAIQELRNVVSPMGGYVIVKHLPLYYRQKVDAWGEKPSSFFLLEGIKSKIDPNRILNSKRFIGGI